MAIYLVGSLMILLVSSFQGNSYSYYPPRSRIHPHPFAQRKGRIFLFLSSSIEPEGEPSRSIYRPTETLPERIPPPSLPSQPKIVVLGASGKIGRLVVRQLLEQKNPITVVAFVRDYDKACRVLMDDIVFTSATTTGKRKGPTLEIVQGNLVPPEDLPFEDGEIIDEEDAMWLERAKSAAKFYNTTIQHYDDGKNRNSMMQLDAEEALREAIRGCTAIISAVGDVRPTNFWTDYFRFPIWRIVRKDVSRWCRDPRHPYYVHYASTRKALRLAEQEQRQRESAHGEKSSTIPKIRFVRISDLCVAHKPWGLVSVLTNILHSLVFRYQEMTEELLKHSLLLDTVVIRPGDLVDDERETGTTNLQVDPTGTVPLPSRIGRDDVAALAVESALFDSREMSQRKSVRSSVGEFSHENKKLESFHYTLACRWVGSDMSPYPGQGDKKDGHSTASLALRSALRSIQREERYQERLIPGRTRSTLSLPIWRSNIKAHALFAAVPVYILSIMVVSSILHATTISHLSCRVGSVLRDCLKGVGCTTLFKGRFSARFLTNILPHRSAKQYFSI